MGFSGRDFQSQVTIKPKEDKNDGKKDKKKLSPKIYRQIKKDLSSKGLALIQEDKAVQTISMNQPYDQLLSKIFEDEFKMRNQNVQQTKIPMSPNELLDKLIEVSSKRQRTGNAADDYKESLRLLHLQLQYERYRREVHADRNRRLMGISRQIFHYEQNFETLTEQVRLLRKESMFLQTQLNNSRREFNIREQERDNDKTLLENKYKQEHEENLKLKAMIESLQHQIAEGAKTKKENLIDLESARGEIFDLKTELSQMVMQVEIAQQYKEELARLQSEVTLMGEIQLKCRDKFNSIDLLDEKSIKIERLTESYTEEVRQLKCQLESKTAQLDTAKARLSELENLVSGRDCKYDTLKVQMLKNQQEYEDKIKALDKKYSTQKAIVLRLEEHFLELRLLETRSSTCPGALSPDSERTDIGSLDIKTPLSRSQTSSISSSLKSITEIRNLQEIALAHSSQYSATQSMDIPSTSSRGNV